MFDNKKVILHCDINNFYASVECLKLPQYADKPLAVCGDPAKRHGIVLAKNQLAKAYGVKTGDAVWEAQKKCPGIVLVEPHFDEYMKYSDQVFEIYTRYTDLVEPFGSDECWLDVTGSINLLGDGKKIADELRQVVKAETGLTISVGVSFTKSFAKLGSDLKKPDATSVISPENYKKIAWQLPVDDLIMVGKSTHKILQKLNIFTIGDLANADLSLLKTHLGLNGVKLWEFANGADSEAVRPYYKGRVPQSIGHGVTTIRSVDNYDDAIAVIYYLADMVAARLRKHNFRASGVSLGLRDENLTSISRQANLPSPTAAASEIAPYAIKLLKNNWDFKINKLRTITVSTFKLTEADSAQQISIFENNTHEKKLAAEQAIDKIRKKYGSNIIARGISLGKSFIYDKNEAEDFLPFKR